MSIQIIVIITAVLEVTVMSTVSTRTWDSLEQWTDTVFLVAGASFFGATVLLIINRFLSGLGATGQTLEAVFYITGLIGLPIGLLGFYPRAKERSPRLALVGVAAAALAVLGYVGAIVSSVVGFALTAVSLPTDSFALLSFVLVLIGFLVFGGISIQSDTHSRTVGVLLLGIVAAFLGYLAMFAFVGTDPPDWIPATAGGTFTVITAFTVIHLADLAGLVSSDPADAPSWFNVFIPLALIGFVVGYLAFGVASLRTNVHSRTVGLLLLVPGLIVVWMVVQTTAGYADELTAFVVAAGEAMAHLAIGATLRTKSSATDRDESSTDDDREPVAHD